MHEPDKPYVQKKIYIYQSIIILQSVEHSTTLYCDK